MLDDAFDHLHRLECRGFAVNRRHETADDSHVGFRIVDRSNDSL